MRRLGLLFMLLGIPAASTGGASSACDLHEFEKQYRTIVREVLPSVVTVTAYLDMERPRGGADDGLESLKKTVGSGVVVNDQGHVLTTASVVGSSRKLYVRTLDGEDQPAVLLGAHPRADLALLMVGGVRLEPARLGRSSALTPGSWLITVGQSHGVYPGCTFGSVTALTPKHESIVEGGLIQMTSRAFPGQTGGAVVNLEGEVVGILLGALSDVETQSRRPAFAMARLANTPVADLETAFSVALPIETVRQVIAELAENGSVSRGFLGVKVRMPTPALKKLLKFESGVLIDEVIPGSPAAHAAIEAGDVILAFDGSAVRHEAELVRLVSQRPGRRCVVQLLRGDIRLERLVTVGAVPSGLESAPPAVKQSSSRAAIERRIEVLRDELQVLEAELRASP